MFRQYVLTQGGFRFSLGKRRGVCPACGRRTFKFYVDTVTGEILDSRCGRCNRENSCGYHEPPSRFKDSFKSMTHQYPRPPTVAVTPPPLSTMPLWMVRATLAADLSRNSLFRYLDTRWNHTMLLDAFAAMEIGTARFGGGSPVYWLRDRDGNYRSGKVMAYDPDTGHRLKSDGHTTVSYAHTLARLPDYNFQACYYGEYAAASNPGASLIVVESEKTALIVRLALATLGVDTRRFVTVATSGASNFGVDPFRLKDPRYRMSVLYDRDIIVIPDADMTARWSLYADRLRPYVRSLRFVDVTAEPFRLDGSADIGDWILANNTPALRAFSATIRINPR